MHAAQTRQWQSSRNAAQNRPAVHCASRPIQWTASRGAARRVVAGATPVVPPVVLAPADSRPAPLDGFELACPICHTTDFKVLSQAATGPALPCPSCSRDFSCNATFADLTLTSGVSEAVYQPNKWLGTSLFETPQISWLYERGWRSSFARAGFPGPDREFDLASGYLRPVQGGTVVDMSCGSGLFTRKFATSGLWQRVVAVDFSENMLKQTEAFIAEDASIDRSKVLLVRADVGRLPFKSGSVDAIHAGAAIHCWPDPRQALAEISRVLAPGGVFVGTTFMYAFAQLGEVFGDDNVRGLKMLDPYASEFFKGGYRYWEEAELKELCTSVGLQNFERTRMSRFIMWAATKPGLRTV